MEKRYKFETEFCKQETVNGEPVGIFRGLASTFDVDTDGDRIAKQAFDRTIAESKRENIKIIMRWMHIRTEVIGGFPASKIEITPKGLFVEGEANLKVQKGSETFSLIKQDVIRTMSINFSIVDQMFNTNENVRDILDLDLVEISPVDKPANKGAVITEVKSVTPFLDLPLASEDRQWDADQAIQRVKRFTDSTDAPSRAYRRAFLWFDGENADSFGAYKLPYTDVIDGQLKAVPRGLFAAAGALQGARGGVNIPENEAERVKNNVARYFRKMDRDNPFKSIMTIDEINSMKDINSFLKSLGLSNMERNRLIHNIKKYGVRDALDDLDSQRDVEVMSETLASGLDKILNTLR